ncbi:hypothetical protein [Lysobacter sp. A289]
MSNLFRWLTPVALAAGIGLSALAPVPAHANGGDDLVRVLVNAADVIFNNGHAYYQDDYRNNRRGANNRLIVVRDNRGNPRYYRNSYRSSPRNNARDVKCNKHGKCKVKATYYDPRYDRDRSRYRARNDRDSRRYYSRSYRDRDDD